MIVGHDYTRLFLASRKYLLILHIGVEGDNAREVPHVLRKWDIELTEIKCHAR